MSKLPNELIGQTIRTDGSGSLMLFAEQFTDQAQSDPVIDTLDRSLDWGASFGQDGILLYSGDDGATYAQVGPTTNETIVSVAVSATGQVAAIGDQGSLFRHDRMAPTPGSS